jgi:voltage-gated potassium channel
MYLHLFVKILTIDLCHGLKSSIEFVLLNTNDLMRELIFRTLNGYKTNSSYGKKFDLFISTLIVLNVVAFILASYPQIQRDLRGFLFWFELFSVIIFSLEYLLGIYTAPLLYPEMPAWRAIVRFTFSFYGIIDLVAILPFYLPFMGFGDMRYIRALRFMRLARLFKLNRHSSNIRMLGDILKEKRKYMIVVVSSVLIILVIAASLMYSIEGEMQPDAFPHIGAAIWWALATLTTIGYGDIVPITGWGKLLSGIIALMGIAIVALPTGILSSAFIERIQRQKRHRDTATHGREMHYCPHCGKALHD